MFFSFCSPGYPFFKCSDEDMARRWGLPITGREGYRQQGQLHRLTNQSLQSLFFFQIISLSCFANLDFRYLTKPELYTTEVNHRFKNSGSFWDDDKTLTVLEKWWFVNQINQPIKHGWYTVYLTSSTFLFEPMQFRPSPGWSLATKKSRGFIDLSRLS